MDLKITGICGSPIKDGNTEYLLKELLRNAEKLDDVQTEFIPLVGKKLEGCPADCNWCAEHQKENDFCSLKDDMQDLYPKVLDSDALIYGNPVYIARETWILRAFLDRLSAFAIGRYYGFEGPEKGVLVNKPVTSAQVAWFRHGGIETAMFSIYEISMYYGMIPVSPGFGFGIGGVSEAPSGEELAVEEDSFAHRRASELGERFAEVTKMLKYGRTAFDEIEGYKLGEPL